MSELVEQVVADVSAATPRVQLRQSIQSLVDEHDERLRKGVRAAMVRYGVWHGILVILFFVVVLLPLLAFFVAESYLSSNTAIVISICAPIFAMFCGLTNCMVHRMTLQRKSLLVSKVDLQTHSWHDSDGNKHGDWTYLAISDDGESLPLDKNTYVIVKSRLDKKQKKSSKKVKLECGYSYYLNWHVTWPPYCID